MIGIRKEEAERRLLCEDTETQGERGHRKMKIKIGAMLSQARNAPGAIGSWKRQERIFPFRLWREQGSAAP